MIIDSFSMVQITVEKVWQSVAMIFLRGWKKSVFSEETL